MVIDTDKVLEVFESNGYTVCITLDCDPESPLEWGEPYTEESTEYRAYENGEVYGFEIYDKYGDIIDSRYGFYGDIDHCRNSAQEIIKGRIFDAGHRFYLATKIIEEGIL